MYYLFDNLGKKKKWGWVGGKRGWLMLTESDRGERAAGFVFPADPNTESFLTRPTRHGVTE